VFFCRSIVRGRIRIGTDFGEGEGGSGKAFSGRVLGAFSILRFGRIRYGSSRRSGDGDDIPRRAVSEEHRFVIRFVVGVVC